MTEGQKEEEIEIWSASVTQGAKFSLSRTLVHFLQSHLSTEEMRTFTLGRLFHSLRDDGTQCIFAAGS